MMGWSYPPETPVLILLFHREEEGANHTPTMPRRNPPETPVLNLLLHLEEEGAVPFQLYRECRNTCGPWLNKYFDFWARKYFDRLGRANLHFD